MEFLHGGFDDLGSHLGEVRGLLRGGIHRGAKVLDGVFGPAGRLEAHQQFQELPGVARAQGAGLLELVGRELPLQAGEVAQQIRPPRQFDPALAVLVLHRPHPAHLHPRRRQRLAVALVGRLVERDRAVVELLGRALELVIGRVHIDLEGLGVFGGGDLGARHLAGLEHAAAVQLGHRSGHDAFLGQRQAVACPRERIAHRHPPFPRWPLHVGHVVVGQRLRLGLCGRPRLGLGASGKSSSARRIAGLLQSLRQKSPSVTHHIRLIVIDRVLSDFRPAHALDELRQS